MNSMFDEGESIDPSIKGPDWKVVKLAEPLELGDVIVPAGLTVKMGATHVNLTAYTAKKCKSVRRFFSWKESV